MSLIICSECGHENQEDARYCDMCGIELPLSTPAEVSSTTEEIQPDDYEEEVTPVILGVNLEQEVHETPIAEIPEVTPLEQEEIMSISEEEPQLVAENPEPISPITPATILDWDEPELSSVPSTSLEVIQGILVHPETETRFKFPSGEILIYLGKVNEEIPVHIDFSELPDADIISRVHAVIHLEEQVFYLEDAGSLNGTAINGEPVKPGARFRKQLNSGDTITLGRNRKINLTFEIEE